MLAALTPPRPPVPLPAEPRTVHVLHVLSTAQRGGTERMVERLVRHSHRPGEVLHRVVSLEPRGPVLDDLADIPGALALPPEVGTPAPTARQHLRRIRSLLSGGQHHVVHLYGLRADVLLRGMAARSGARVVSAIRSTDPWRRWWHTALDAATARHVTLWISNSEAGSRAAMARQRLDPHRVVTVASGVEGPDLGMPGARERLRHDAREALAKSLASPLPAHTTLWVCLANLRWMKGHDVLLRAWAEAIGPRADGADSPPWVLAMVGADGADRAGQPLRPQLEAFIAQRAIQRHCLLPGPGDAGLWLAAADAAVLASQHEGMPASLLEAMAWQLPVVATAVGGIPEMVDDGREGLLVKSNTDRAAMIAELRAAMHALSADAHRREAMGRAARERHQRHHQLDHMVSRLDAIYATVARTPKSCILQL